MIAENKLPDVVYTRETPFIEFLEGLRRINSCPESMEYYERVYKENPRFTLGEVIKEYPPKQSWAVSQLSFYGEQLDKGVRLLLMDYVKDDVMNYKLWKRLINITDDEREMLREKFRGKLPNIERKL